MHPVLFELWRFRAPAYGTALALAFTIGTLVAFRRARRAGLDPLPVIDGSLVIVLGALVGARLLFVVTHLELFRPPRGGWGDVFLPVAVGSSRGVAGLSMLGGVLLAISGLLLLLRLRRLPVLRYCDVIAPSVALGEAITRIGCFLNGCCYGTACDLPWAVVFPPGSPAASVMGSTSLHPAQLYTSVASLALFGLLIRLASRARRPGTVFCALLIGLGTSRFLLDLVRHYEGADVALRWTGGSLSLHQLVALGLLACGIAGLWRLRRGALDSGAPCPTVARRAPSAASAP